MIAPRFQTQDAAGQTGSTVINHYHLNIPDKITDAIMAILGSMTGQPALFQRSEFVPTTTTTQPGQVDASSSAATRKGHSADKVSTAGNFENEPAGESLPKTKSVQLLSEVYKSHAMEIVKSENRPSMLTQNGTAIKHFEEWYKNKYRSTGPVLADLCQHPNLLSEFYQFRLEFDAPSTAANKLKSLRKIWSILEELGMIDQPVPKSRMGRILKRSGFEAVTHVPIPVTEPEINRILESILQLADVLDYPRLGKLEPFQFWFNVVAISAVHGIRPADFWPLHPADGKGLLWSEISFDASPPILHGSKLGADWDFGYLHLRMNKTGKRLTSPMSPHLSWLVHAMEGLDKERVFPLPYNRVRWYAMLDQIFEKAGFERFPVKHGDGVQMKWPVSLCGPSPQTSLRKSASVLWRRHGGKALASAMLGHSVRSGSTADVEFDLNEGSDITDIHYNGSLIFAEIIKAYPQILSNLPLLIRC